MKKVSVVSNFERSNKYLSEFLYKNALRLSIKTLARTGDKVEPKTAL